jgi:uncharacterized protein (DUF1501 family)
VARVLEVVLVAVGEVLDGRAPDVRHERRVVALEQVLEEDPLAQARLGDLDRVEAALLHEGREDGRAAEDHVAAVGLDAGDGSALGRRPTGELVDQLLQDLALEHETLRSGVRVAEVALGGHGEPFTDHRSLIDKRLRQQDERAAELLRLLSDGPRSAHQLATSLWGDVAITQAFLTLSEVLGHIDMLIDEGLVAEDDAGPVIRFEAL